MRANKQVICADGYDLVFLSDKDAAKFFNCSRATIWRVVNSGKVFQNTFLYTMPYDAAVSMNKRFYTQAYCDHTWIVAENYDENGRDAWFYDLKEAAEFFGCSKQYIHKCLKTGTKCKGVSLKYGIMDDREAYNYRRIR